LTVCVRNSSESVFNDARPVCAFCFDPSGFCENYLTKTAHKILAFLYDAKKRHRFVHHSQSTIAARVGCCRETVNRLMRVLCAYGLVRKRYRHNDSCIYELSSLFKLKRVINNIKWVLTSLPDVVIENVTRLSYLVISKLNNIRISCPCSYLTYDSKRARDRKDGFLGKLTQTTSACPPPVCQRGGRVMNKPNWGARVKAIEEVSQTLDLSRYGKANLSIFPESALRHAHDTMIKSLKRGTEIKNTFAYLHELAYKATKEQNLELNYSLFDRYNFSESEKNPLISKKISLPPEPKRERKMHPSYAPWHKKEEHYDIEHEVKGFEDLEKSDTLGRAQSIFGQEMATFLKRCKHNVITKAMSCSMEGTP